MKEKIIAAIKAKFPAINLSKARLAKIAEAIEKKVIDDESKIDAMLNEFNEFHSIADIAKEDDKLRDVQHKLKTTGQSKPEEAKPEAEELPADMPEWAKLLAGQNKKLNDTIAQMQAAGVNQSIRQQAEGKLKEIPVSYWGKRVLPEKVEDLENFVTEVTTDFAAFTKDLSDKGIAQVPKPGGNNQPTSAKGVSPALKAAFPDKTVQVVSQPAAQGSSYINTPSPI